MKMYSLLRNGLKLSSLIEIFKIKTRDVLKKTINTWNQKPFCAMLYLNAIFNNIFNDIFTLYHNDSKFITLFKK